MSHHLKIEAYFVGVFVHAHTCVSVCVLLLNTQLYKLFSQVKIAIDSKFCHLFSYSEGDKFGRASHCKELDIVYQIACCQVKA